jgi:hypothetical protein
LAAAKPDISFQVEYLLAVAQEMVPLIVRHHAEVEPPDIPLDVAWNELLALNAAGFLRVLTARDGVRLIGYVCTTIRCSLWSKPTLQAYVDAYYLDPTYRTGWTAYRMFKENDRMLRGLKVKRIFIAAEHVYKDARAGCLFRRLGYKWRSDAYGKVIR